MYVALGLEWLSVRSCGDGCVCLPLTCARRAALVRTQDLRLISNVTRGMARARRRYTKLIVWLRPHVAAQRCGGGLGGWMGCAGSGSRAGGETVLVLVTHRR